MRWHSALVVVVAACSYDRAEWRPAKSGAEHPAAKDAYRVHRVESECERIGTAIASDGSQIESIAETAARHGGTHYVVSGDETETTGYQVQTTAVGNGPVMIASSKVTPEKSRTVTAIVYRCP